MVACIIPAMSYTIRPAKESDLDVITAIYGEAVELGTASFELAVPDRTEMARRYHELVDQGYPFFALEDGGRVRGYAYAGPYRTRPAYRFMVEDTIYLDAKARGKGYGKALLTALIEECTRLGFRQMMAVIGDANNRGSVGLHRALGFEITGTMKDVGWKHSKWLDVVLMQLPLGQGGATAPDKDCLPARMFALRKGP